MAEAQRVEEATIDDQAFNKSQVIGMPSLTTWVFISILVLILSFLIPIDQETPIFIAVYMFLQLGIVLLIFFVRPGWIIKNNHMKKMDAIDSEFSDWVKNTAFELNIHPAPLSLYTEKLGVPLQVFGTFQRTYVVVNKNELDFARKHGFMQDLKAMLLHELAHIKNQDYWKYSLAKDLSNLYFITIIFSFFLIIFGMADSAISSAPYAQTLHKTTAIVIILVGVLLLFLVRFLTETREYYADLLVKEILGKDVLISAILTSAKMWPNHEGTKTSNLVENILYQFSKSSNRYSLERIRAIQVTGLQFHKNTQKFIFFAGLVTGIMVLERNIDVLFLMSVMVIGSLLGSVCLLPYWMVGGIQLKSLLMKAVESTIRYFAGIFIGILLFIVIVALTMSINKVFFPAVFFEGIEVTSYYAISILSIFLSITIGLCIFSVFVKTIYRNNFGRLFLKKGALLLIVPFSQVLLLSCLFIYFLSQLLGTSTINYQTAILPFLLIFLFNFAAYWVGPKLDETE